MFSSHLPVAFSPLALSESKKLQLKQALMRCQPVIASIHTCCSAKLAGIVLLIEPYKRICL
jgi:hypothetical protein